MHDYAVMTSQDLLMASIPSLLTGVVGYGAAALAYRQKDRRGLRRSAAHSVIPRLETLRHLARISDREADSAEWHSAAADALDAIEAELHRLPEPWQHLQQSVRIAIGEATGVFAFAERTPYEPGTQLVAYSGVWAGNAEEYLTYALRRLRVWRDDLPPGRRGSGLVSFDAWLQRRERESGDALPLAGAR
jgi:hypothetical protein